MKSYTLDIKKVGAIENQSFEIKPFTILTGLTDNGEKDLLDLITDISFQGKMIIDHIFSHILHKYAITNLQATEEFEFDTHDIEKCLEQTCNQGHREFSIHIDKYEKFKMKGVYDSGNQIVTVNYNDGEPKVYHIDKKDWRYGKVMLIHYLNKNFRKNYKFPISHITFTSNVHPEDQVQEIDDIMKSYNKGIWQVIFTHSDYSLQRINQYIKLGVIYNKKKSIYKDLLKECNMNDSVLDIDDINHYFFDKQDNKLEVKNVKVDENGTSMVSFYNIVNQLTDNEHNIDDQLDNILYGTSEENVDNW